MSEDDKEKVVPFGAKKKAPPEKVVEVKKTPKTIDWASSSESEKAYNKAVFLIEAHTANILENMAEYFRENNLFDPRELNEDQFRDMMLIKEAIVSMFSRRVGMQHDLHQFILNHMSIPIPDDKK